MENSNLNNKEPTYSSSLQELPDFNIVDILNKLFMSKNFQDLKKFYSYFDNSAELITWMRNRPNGAAKIIEVEGDKDIIVVIPTANFEGKLAKKCKDEVFQGLHVIFVESLKPYDPYFHLERNVNIGIKKALEYSPKWVVYSNDDVYKIDPPSKLQSLLSSLNESKYDVVFTTPSKYHSIPVRLSQSRLSRNILFALTRERRYQLFLERKFDVSYFSSPDYGLWKLFFKNGYKHLSIADFGIFSANYLISKKGILFDETYLNDTEDIDLSLGATYNQDRTIVISYRIGDMMGMTLGRGTVRAARGVAGYAYLNHKIKTNEVLSTRYLG